MTEARGIEETYQSACATSNLKVEAERRGSGDILVAAGWSTRQAGVALLRLHSEWDSTSRVAMDQNARGYLAEVALRLQRCKSLPSVRSYLITWATRKNVAPDIAIATLAWWLDKICPSCQGRRWQIVPTTPMLSSKPCHTCRASGERPLAGGADGHKMAAHIDVCVADARHSIKQRLRG